MHTITRILCPTDFSEGSRQALDHAVTLAHYNDASITLFHVESPIALGAYSTVTPTLGADVLASDQQPALVETLKAFAARSTRPGTRLDVKLARGRAADEILAESGSADVIVIGTHGRSGFERLMLGSVTEKIVRKARCPVITVPPRAHEASADLAPYQRIVCAVDFSESSMTALSEAATLRGAEGAALTLVHVVELPPGLSTVGGDLALAGARELKAYVAAAEQDARTLLNAAIEERLGGRPNVSAVVLTGRPYTKVLELAEKNAADLIVMGVRGRGTTDLLFFGSTAEHVVRQATCPVLTLRGA